MVRPKESRALLAAIGAAQAVGNDPQAWPVALIDELRSILPARVGIFGVSRGFAPDQQPAGILTIRHGWSSPDHERLWLAYADTPVKRTPEYNSLINFDGRQITRLRDQLWGRDAWYRSRTYLEVHQPAGLDDSVISICRQADGPHTVSIWMHRAPGDPAFTRREWWLMHVITAEIARQLELILALPHDRVDTLTPRQRQTLERLLAGDSEKQAALALGVKRSTVHEHVLALYRHFGVSSRSELLALFVGRHLPPPANPTV